MDEKQTKTIAAVGLFTGGIFGIIGSFVSSASFRGLAWGVDGVGLIVATALTLLALPAMYAAWFRVRKS